MWRTDVCMFPTVPCTLFWVCFFFVFFLFVYLGRWKLILLLFAKHLGRYALFFLELETTTSTTTKEKECKTATISPHLRLFGPVSRQRRVKNRGIMYSLPWSVSMLTSEPVSSVAFVFCQMNMQRGAVARVCACIHRGTSLLLT